MPFDTWLRTWLKRHPLKQPQPFHTARYTAEVMTRVRRVAAAPATEANFLATLRRWSGWTAGLTLATAAAALVIVIGVHHQMVSQQLARYTPEDLRQVASINRPPEQPLQEHEVAVTPSPEANHLEPLVLADASVHERQWVEQALALLEQVDETSAWDAVDETATAALLQELQWHDEQELVRSRHSDDG